MSKGKALKSFRCKVRNLNTGKIEKRTYTVKVIPQFGTASHPQPCEIVETFTGLLCLSLHYSKCRECSKSPIRIVAGTITDKKYVGD